MIAISHCENSPESLCSLIGYPNDYSELRAVIAAQLDPQATPHASIRAATSP